MPEVVLQDYLEDINQLIEESRLGEAVRHCRAILEQYPRHIDTYRLLGKAYLEQGELQAASDVFHRVLSADPEDFIAHAGMAIVYKQEERLKESVWHMQRAFEMDPYNGAIQEALKDLYSKRDGLPEGQLPLTRGALARLYVKGELYSQAIAELRELLAEDPTRVDLQALLAEALWRDGQRVDAVEVCQRLLEELPSCIKANAILGEVWMVTDRQDEAAEYIERVFEMTLPAHDVLEDDTPAGRLFLTPWAPKIPQQVLVEQLAASDTMDMVGAEADWAIDFSLDDADLANEEPEWLEAMQSSEGAANDAEVDQAADEMFEDAVGEVADGDATVAGSDESATDLERVDDADQWLEQMDDVSREEAGESSTRWLRGSLSELQGLGEAEEETDWATWLDHEESDEPQAAVQQEVISEFEEEGMGATDDFGKSQDDMPEEETPRQEDDQPVEDAGIESFDWLDELGDAEDPAYSEQAFSEDPLAEDRVSDDLFSDDIFAGDAFSKETASEETEMAADELPDWLAEDAGVLAESDSALDWLDDDEGSEQVMDDDVTELSSEDTPDWLSEDAMESPADMPAEGADDDLSWLDDLAAGEGSPIEEPPTMTWPEDETEQTPEAATEDPFADWADQEDETADEVTGASLDEEPVVAEEGALDDVTPGVVSEHITGGDMATGDTADDADTMDDVPEDLDEAMAWLEQLAAQQGAPVEELPSLSNMEDADEEAVLEQMPADIGDAMDWLDELAEGEDVAEPAEMALLEDAESDEELGWLEGLGGPAAAAGAIATDESADSQSMQEPTIPVSASGFDEVEDEEVELDWLGELGGPVVGDESVSGDEGYETEPVEEPVTPVSAAALEELDDEDSEALDWLDELVAEDVEQASQAAADEQAMEAPGEVPDFLASDATADEGEDEVPEDLDDALHWLEELAAQQGAPAEELPSLQAESSAVEEVAQEESPVASAEPTPAAEASADDDDDLDWLEGLDDEGELDDSWLDELEAVDEAQEQPQMVQAGDVAAAEEAESDEVPEDIDEAMAWLEQLAARQGAPVDELPSLDELSGAGATAATADAMAELEDIPDDPEAALAWLEALAEGETEVDEEAQVVDEPSTPAVPHDVVAARAEAEAILMHDEMDSGAAPSEAEIFDDIPEDPDEAMAWLEKLAARQGAPLDELPSVTEADEEVETPEWIAREAEEVTEAITGEVAEPDTLDLTVLEPEADVFAVEGESEAEDEVAEPVAEADEEQLTVTEELADELTAELDFGDEQLDEAMPDWLSLEDDDAEEAGFAWDEVEGDVAGWLQAEEEATQHEMKIPDVAAASADLAQPGDSQMEEVQASDEPAMEAEVAKEPEVAEEAIAPGEPSWEPAAAENEQLSSARRAVESGDLDAAVASYGELVEAGADLNLLISDLEGAVAAQSSHSRLRTVLGDAYMRNGQLQNALDAYRQALDSL